MSALRRRVDSGGGGGSGSVVGREPPAPDGVLTATPDAEGCDRSDDDCAPGEEGPSPGQLYGAWPASSACGWSGDGGVEAPRLTGTVPGRRPLHLED